MLHPHHRVIAKQRRLAHVKTAISRHQRRIRPVQLQSFLVEQKHRHARLVFGFVPNLLHLKRARINRHSRLRPHLQPPRSHIAAINRRRYSERLKRKERFAFFPSPRHSPDGPQLRQRNSPRRAPIRLKYFQLRGGVVRILRHDLPAHQPKIFHTRFAFRNNFLPVFLRRCPQRHRHQPPFRRFPIRLQKQSIVRDRALKTSIQGIHHRYDRPCNLQILKIDFRPVASRPVENRKQQISLVLRQFHRQNLVRRVAIPKNFGVLCRIRSHRVKISPRPFLLQFRIVKSALILPESRPGNIARPRQHILTLFPSIRVQKMQRYLVLAALAHSISHQFPVVRNALEIHARAVIWAQFLRIHQHFVLALGPASHIKDEQILVGPALRVKIFPAALDRHPDRIHLDQFPQPFRNRVSASQLLKRRLRADIFRFNPRPRFRAILLLEPAIRIVHHRSMNRLCHVLDPRQRRTLRLRILCIHSRHARSQK